MTNSLPLNKISLIFIYFSFHANFGLWVLNIILLDFEVFAEIYKRSNILTGYSRSADRSPAPLTPAPRGRAGAPGPTLARRLTKDRPAGGLVSGLLLLPVPPLSVPLFFLPARPVALIAPFCILPVSVALFIAETEQKHVFLTAGLLILNDFKL